MRGFQGNQDVHGNSIILGGWSTALVLASIWLLIPVSARPACLAGAAGAAVAAGAALHRVSLAWQGSAFLLAAVWLSGLFAYTFQVLAGTPAGAPALSVWLAAMVALLCYGLVQLGPETLRDAQPFPLLFASIAALAAAALLAHGAARLAADAFDVRAHHLALIRSFILCAAALALAFSGAHWRRRELTQIGYAVVLLEALKLLAEDLRHGHMAYVAASVCLFALTLMAIPRVSHARSR